MLRTILRILVLTAVCSCLAAPAAAQQTPAKPDWKEGFKEHDTNHDGKIDRGEFQEWMVDVFFLRDKNHKGYLVYEDVKDAMTTENFKAHDKNGDGKIPLQEFLNATFQDFAAADVNQNGALTMEEIQVYISRPSK
jgi:hypothetical protein